MSGKGDTPRPLSVSDDEFARRWAAAFGTTERAGRRRAGSPPKRAVLGSTPSRPVPRITTDAGSNLIRGMLEAGDAQKAREIGQREIWHQGPLGYVLADDECPCESCQ